MAISSILRGHSGTFGRFLEVDGVRYYITAGELEDLNFGLACGDLRLIKQIITEVENRGLADKLRLEDIKSRYYQAYREDTK